MLTFTPHWFDHSQGSRVLMPVAAVMVLTGACVKALPLQSTEREADSLSLHIDAPRPYGHLDVFIYSDTLTKALESHWRSDSARTLRLPCGKGDKIIVALADVRGEFGEKLPATYDAMENISMDYAGEDPSAPFQSGFCYVQGPREADLRLSPLLCSVNIGSISLQGDAPLCAPVLSLRHVSAAFPILRQDGFHPSHTLDGPDGLDFPLMMLRSLPFDIASVPQQAGITLYCYPNEDEAGPGGGGTELVVSGYYLKELREFYIPLGNIKRGGCIYIDVKLE